MFRLAPLLLAAALLPAAQVNVRQAPYRAAGNGKTDDTAAIQRALDDTSAAGGGVVFLPAGMYLVASHLRVPPGVAVTGVGRAPRSWSPKQPGSTLLAVEGAGEPGGTPFLTLAGPNSTLDGITVFYPKQVVANPPAPYPWTVRAGGGDNVSLINVLLVNPYQAVDFATHPSGRHYIRGLYGQPLYKGLWVDQCYDIGRVKDVHFWPFWSLDKKIIDYTTANGTTFIFQRTDWEIVDDIFCWGYKVGVELSASKHGAMNGQMANINLDNVDIGIDARQTQPYAIHVSNLNIANAGAGAEHVAIWGRLSQKPAELSVRGGSFWGSLHQVLRWEIPGAVTLADSRIVQWEAQKPAIELLAGRAMIHDNSFASRRDRTGTAIHVGPGVDRASIHDNLLNGHQITNQGPPRVQVNHNLP